MPRVNVPTKSEKYSIAARKLTHEEMLGVAHDVVKDARIYFEDPRAWPSYDMFLGHQISKALLQYQIGMGDLDELDKFVSMVTDRKEG